MFCQFFQAQNSKLLSQNYFKENTDYTVNRNCRLGIGSNGTIYLVSLPKKRMEIVVKEVGCFFCLVAGTCNSFDFNQTVSLNKRISS